MSVVNMEHSNIILERLAMILEVSDIIILSDMSEMILGTQYRRERVCVTGILLHLAPHITVGVDTIFKILVSVINLKHRAMIVA